jgi:RimJ/RimL family protein N-acetyltransferase
MQILITERLRLRHLELTDAAFILDLLNQPAFLRFIGDRNVRSLADAENYLRNGPLEMYARQGFGLYLVERKVDGVPLGICGLLKREVLEHVDLGYAFLPQYWSQGYAREAALGMLAYARDTLQVKTVVAIVDPQNEASIKLLEKIGMTYLRPITWPTDGKELKLYTVDL